MVMVTAKVTGMNRDFTFISILGRVAYRLCYFTCVWVEWWTTDWIDTNIKADNSVLKN